MSELLRILDDEVAARCGAITRAHPDWPCRAGCDPCCRHLAGEPSLTAAEWERIEQLVPAEWIRARLAPAPAGPPYTCPFLENSSGACAIYRARPVACRTYGFYVERDKGLYCSRLEERPNGDVVWGNHTSIERRLEDLGPRIPLRVRFRVE